MARLGLESQVAPDSRPPLYPKVDHNPRPPNVPLLRGLWSLVVRIWDILKGSWGVLDGDKEAPNYRPPDFQVPSPEVSRATSERPCRSRFVGFCAHCAATAVEAGCVLARGAMLGSHEVSMEFDSLAFAGLPPVGQGATSASDTVVCKFNCRR